MFSKVKKNVAGLLNLQTFQTNEGAKRPRASKGERGGERGLSVL